MSIGIKFDKAEDILFCEFKPVLSYRVTYPSVSGFIGKRAETTINRFYEQSARNALRQIRTIEFPKAEKRYRESLNDGFPFEMSEVISESSCTFKNDRFISIRQDSYIYNGGANGSNFRKAQTWRIDNGTFAGLETFFRDRDPIQRILRIVTSRILYSVKSGEGLYFPDAPKIAVRMFDRSRFYLSSEDTLTVFYPEYALGPKCTGIAEFKIPRDLIFHQKQ